ncbi:chemotaxis protein CheW [Salinisphaera sp. SPP-AMP-43]|uniref:chemotaxis protein CheW n=1 Tax=Salinisphaera sp. SPP-AMP-43 TaxID=3121288 RepID=UPI003C6DB9E8
MDVSDFYETFFEEADELLEDMERLLIELDTDAPDRDQLDAIFRAAHSIKGGAGTFGFQALQDTTHRMENLLDLARHGELTLDRPTVDVLLETSDLLKSQIEAYRSESEPDAAAAERICAVLQQLAEGESAAKAKASNPAAASSPTAAEPSSTAGVDAAAGRERSLRVVISGVTESERETLAGELALFGTVGQRQDGDARLELTLTSTESLDDIKSVLCFIVDDDQISIVPAEEDSAAPDTRVLQVRVTDINAHDRDKLVEEIALFGTVSQRQDEADTLTVSLTTAESIVDIQVVLCLVVDADQLSIEPQTDEADRSVADAAPATVAPDAGKTAAEPPAVPAGGGGGAGKGEGTAASAGSAKPRRESSSESTSVRVPTDKIDHIINLVGELVITQSMLDRAVQDLGGEEGEALSEGMSQLQRNARDLQEAVMSVRMVPMDFAFNRFPRLVRDLSSKLGKDVELVTVGGATELDKGLIERIMDPMTHLVRNSLDHGIEDAETRAAVGKPAAGRLTLSARHEGGNVVIEIGDDGAGLSRERILAKAKSSGLNVTDDMPDDEVWQLIFAPGFSTADQVSDVSGRGVGMDVVKRNIQQLGGHVDLSSQTGAGTTVRIILPLTLAIMDGMAVRAGSEVFILPLGAILESMQIDDDRVRTVSSGSRVIEVRGDYLPLVELQQAFDIADAKTRLADGIVVVVQSESRRFALFVDELIGQQQVVVKNLETHFRKVAGVSAATILGDGSVALILDATALSRMTHPGRRSNKPVAHAVGKTAESVES